MKRTLQVMMMLFAGAQMANAQAVLPTSWNFDDATPEGWTESLNAGNTRYATGESGQACRLDGTADYVLVEFNEEPGELTYFLKGQNSGGSWEGTFTVEESADGDSFTALHTFEDGEIPATEYTEYTDQPASATRYIRFYYTEKVSGHNLALDEVSLVQPTATVAQEINITDGTTNIPSGLTYSMGNASSQEFTIENLGLTESLNISDIVLSGADAAQFSLGTIPTTVGAQSSESFTLTFTPVGDGSRFATLTITNDDASEGTYVINVYAIAGTLATEPVSQATDLWFPGLNAFNFEFNFDPAVPAAEGYIVLRKKGAAVTELPADGSTYVKGEWIGGAQVVHVGDAGSYDARYVEVSTSYHFAVFTFNGPDGFENYLTASPLTGVATTDDPAIGSYYSGLNHASATFVDDLTEKLDPANYFQVYYSNYISTMINEFYVRDTAVAGVPLNFVECQYSGFDYLYPAAFQFWNGQDETEISREHCYPQSWMPTYFDAGFEDSHEVSDLFNLLPVKQEECNAIRSNYPYGEVEEASYAYLNSQFGENAIGQEVYEPRDEIKGDGARAIMYHAVKNNTDLNDFSLPENISIIIPYGQNEYLLKQWHFQDLPDNYEKARNEYIFDRQNNRNGFIDSTLFPCFIRFSNLTKWAPIFTANANVLTAVDPGISYQWYMNGEEIEGATSATYEITQTAGYSVEVQQFEQCPVIASAQTSVTYTGIGEINEQTSFSIFPNPSAGELNLNISSNASGAAMLKVIDATGRIAHASNVNLLNGQQNITTGVVLGSGVYMVELHTRAGILTQKLIVE